MKADVVTRSKELIDSIKSNLKIATDARVAHDKSMHQVYIDTHYWVALMVSSGECKNPNTAHERLAASVGRTFACAHRWNKIGSTLVQHSLPHTAPIQAVQLLSIYEEKLPKPIVVQTVGAIKSGKPARECSKPIVRWIDARAMETTKRLKRVARDGKLTPTHIKMELMALLTGAKSAFRRDDLIITVTDSNYRPLVTVGDDAAVAIEV